MQNQTKTNMLNKFISALIVVMLVISSYGSFIVEAVATDINYVSDKNVIFDAYFKNEENLIYNIEEDTKNENNLYFSLRLKEGIMKNAKIILNNPNFAINYAELKNNIAVKNINEQENIIELNTISEDIEIPVKISYKSNPKMNLLDLQKDTKISFQGIYTDSQKADKKVSGNKNINVKWISKVEGNLQTEVTNYIEDSGKSVIITDTTGKMNNTVVPMEYLEFSSNIPKLAGTLPEEISVIENGKKLLENEFTYDKENEMLIIRKENIANENNEINNLEGNVNYTIAYVYNKQLNLEKISFIAEQNLKLKPYNLPETNISFNNNLEKQKTNQTTVLNINGTENLSKGYMYYQNGEAVYKVDMNLQIQCVLPNKNIEVTETENRLTGDNVNLNLENKTFYINTIIPKREILNILGEQGSLEIYNKTNGELLSVINKDSTEDENGNIVVNYDNISKIKILIKNPENVGNINICSNKKIIKNHGINNNTLKKLNNLKLVYENSNMIFNNTVEKNIKLYETVTKSTMQIDKTEFSTTDDKTKINMKINLNTQNVDYDLYKNPVLKIIFPSEFEIVNIEKVGISFENGLHLENVNMQENADGTKTLTIYLTGEQLTYLNDDITANTQIAVEGEVKVFSNLTSKDTNITYLYTNEKAITYDNNGVCNVPVKITAPYGFIMSTEANGEKSKNKELNELELRANTVSQTIHIKETILNNFDSEISNLELVGMIPIKDKEYKLGDTSINSDFNAKIEGNIYINKDGAKVYFSEDNVNWSEEKTENSNLFKIDFTNSNLNKGEELVVKYNLKIPENITYNKNSYVAFITNGTQNENEVNNWSGMKIKTEDMQLTNKEPEISTVDQSELKTEIAVMKGNVSLKEGETVNNEQTLKYIINLKNETNKTINNINIVAKNTNAVFYEYTTVDLDTELSNKGFYELPDKKQQEFTINELKPGEERKVEYQVVVKKSGENSSTYASINIEAEGIQAKEVKSIENSIGEAKLKIQLNPATTFGYPDEITEETAPIFGINIKNLTNEEINNLTVSLYYTDYIRFESEYVETLPNNRAEFLENENNTVKVKINNIKPEEEVTVYLYGLTNLIEEGKDQISFYTFANTIYNDKEYISGQLDFKINKTLTDFKLVQTSNIEKEVKQDDNLIYETEISNVGKKEALVSISDKVPENAVINKVYINQGNEKIEIKNEGQTISHSLTLKAGEKVKLIIDTIINTYLNNNTEISNTVELVSRQTIETKKSNTITHKIVDELGENGGDEGEGGDGEDGEDETNSISGFVWNDTDKDGVKDSEEVNIPNVRVLLITSAGDILQETLSSSNGYYEFLNLEDGEYRVIFEYDTQKYYLSPYKVNGINENSNSDVLETEIEEDKSKKKVAATESLNIKDKNLTNIDAGLIEYSSRKLNITKTITNVKVKTNKREKEYKFNRKQIAKVEIKSKEMANAQIEVEYAIDIQNVGETEEIIQEIIDTPSSDLKLKDSKTWYKKGDSIATNELENTTILPGETKTIKLVMETKVNNKGEGKNVVNKANIGSLKTQEQNLNIDINSKNNTAQLIIAVSTGAIYITILLTVTLAILVIVAIILIKKGGGLRKNGN